MELILLGLGSFLALLPLRISDCPICAAHAGSAHAWADAGHGSQKYSRNEAGFGNAKQRKVMPISGRLCSARAGAA